MASNSRQNMDKYEYSVFQASNSGRIGNLRPQYGLTKNHRVKERTLNTGNVTRMSVKSMGAKEKATFELALSLIKWEPLYRLDSCNGKYMWTYYQTVIDRLIEICFPSKVVTRHTGDKPWITDGIDY